MRPTFKSEFLPVVLLLASWALVAWYWPHLPAEAPTHWGVYGQPNQWSPRAVGALLGPGIATLMYALLTLIPYIDPRSEHYREFAGVYPVLKNALMAFFLLLTYLTLAASVSPSHALPSQWMNAAIGLLFIVMGNYLPKVRSNWFVGVRTPWTLSSEEVWYRTHRIVGALMVGCGVLMLLSWPLSAGWRFGIVIGSAIALSVVSIGYSYWLFHRLTTRHS